LAAAGRPRAIHDTAGVAIDRNYFSVGVNNPPLQALQNEASGSNAVLKYISSGSFPTGSYQACNYWVDVVFSH